jgi:flavin reductase (DIM6/NTAB) family NADH-FMN oxidoreductase RutF|tara:strand:+ start:3245 stop:3385 length:141 start_codon:yes stop_codon:yes gene_type:complete
VKIDIISSEKKDFDEKFYRNTLGLFVTGISIVTAVDEKKKPNWNDS